MGKPEPDADAEDEALGVMLAVCDGVIETEADCEEVRDCVPLPLGVCVSELELVWDGDCVRLRDCVSEAEDVSLGVIDVVGDPDGLDVPSPDGVTESEGVCVSELELVWDGDCVILRDCVSEDDDDSLGVTEVVGDPDRLHVPDPDSVAEGEVDCVGVALSEAD